MPKREAVALGIVAIVVAVVLPLCNMLPPGSPFSISNFTLNLFGKFLTYAILGLGLPSLTVPEQAVDAQSLIAAAAAVVSAGGTMNREAVALGTPVYTTFGGRLGAVDESLIRDGRLVQLRDAAQLDLDSLPPRRERTRRDPNVLLDLLLGGQGG